MPVGILNVNAFALFGSDIFIVWGDAPELAKITLVGETVNGPGVAGGCVGGAGVALGIKYAKPNAIEPYAVAPHGLDELTTEMVR